MSALSLSAVLQPKDKDEDKDRDRETDTGGSTTLIPQAQTREQRLGSVINDLEKLQSDPPATELSSRVAEPTARAMAQVAGSNTSVAIRAGALESSRASLVEALRKVEDMANRSLSDAERARFLQMALIAIDLAVQDQLDQADFDPDKALKASGSTIGPWVKGFMDTIIAARSEVRRVRNEANKLMGALQVAAVTGEAPVQDAKDFVSKVRESADRADAILQQIWSLTRLPSECYNGFAGGIQQSSEPSQEGS